ncbi:unnamed protein product [Boreogadus saida]
MKQTWFVLSSGGIVRFGYLWPWQRQRYARGGFILLPSYHSVPLGFNYPGNRTGNNHGKDGTTVLLVRCYQSRYFEVLPGWGGAIGAFLSSMAMDKYKTPWKNVIT